MVHRTSAATRAARVLHAVSLISFAVTACRTPDCPPSGMVSSPVKVPADPGAADGKGPVSLVLTPEDKQVIDHVRELLRAKAQLEKDPSGLVVAHSWEINGWGLLDPYSQATMIEFENASPCDVDELRGKLTYVTAQDEELATFPFKARGAVSAGAQIKLEVSVGQVTGKAAKLRVRVEKVRVRCYL